MTDRWTPDQLARNIQWVVAIEYAGGTWFLGDTAMTIDDGVGGSIVISDGLLELSGTEESIDLWSTDSPRRSVQIEFDLGVNVAELVERGHDLAGCVAEVAQLADGDAWTDRRPFVRGRLVEPQYGADGEGVRASVEQDVLSTDETLEALVATRQEIANALVAAGYTLAGINAGDDVTVPIVLGAPTGGESGSTRAIGVCTVLGASLYTAYTIAAHAVQAATVTLINPQDASSVSVPVVSVTLASGAVVSVALDDLAVATWTQTLTPAVSWDAGAGLVAEGVGSISTAGDFIAWLLSLTEQQVDHARVNRARDQLRAFAIATYIDESVSVAEYIREAVLDIVPVSMMVGPRGVYPYVWKWDATSEDAVASWDLTVDLDVSRDGLVTYEDGDRIVNTTQLLYGWRPRAESYAFEMWAVGDPASRPRGLRFGGSASLSRSYWSDPVLARSVVRYGVRSDALESAIIHDDLTASHVLAWRSRRWALPSRVVVYEVAQRWAWIEPGDLVTVTDPDLAWTARLCLVQARAWAEDGSVRYTLRVQEG